MSKIIDSFRNYRQAKKEQKELRAMQEALHVYFDLGGKGLSPKQIQKVNNLLLNSTFLREPRDLHNLQVHIAQCSSLNDGIECLAEDRKRVRERLVNRELVTLFYNYTATTEIYTHKNKIEYYKYNHLGGRAKITASEEKASKITIDPTPYPHMTIIDIDDPKTKPAMAHRIKAEARQLSTYFENVNTRAFRQTKKTM